MSKITKTVDGTLAGLKKAMAGDIGPVQALVAAYKHAPAQPIRDYLDDQALGILVCEMPKLQMVFTEGPSIDRTDMKGVAPVFTAALSEADQQAPELTKQVTATIRSAGEDIGAAVDKAISRVLLDAKTANRMSYLNILSAHANLVKCLCDLEITPAQQAQIDESS